MCVCQMLLHFDLVCVCRCVFVNGSYPSDFAPDFSQNPHKSIPCHYVGPSVCEGGKRNRDFNTMGSSELCRAGMVYSQVIAVC